MPIPSPPRIGGTRESVLQDVVNMTNWMSDVYKAIVLNQEYVRTAVAFDINEFDAGDLPDPANSSIPTAQQTANEAYVLAAAAFSMATGPNSWLEGELTVSEAATTATYTFATELSNADYTVVLTPSGSTGTPAVESFVIVEQAYTTTGFTITVNVAPGAGNSVTFKWHLRQ